MTAYVPGPDAAHFTFTSALAVQLLRVLEPELSPRSMRQTLSCRQAPPPPHPKHRNDAIAAAGRAALLALSLFWPIVAGAAATAEPEPALPRQAGTVTETVCSLVERVARANHISVALLTRLIWTESRFQAHVISPKGAQGIAQFMPETAAQRGLADPFDPEQAIPKAATLLVDLTQRFGNVGLAAAAYNAGSNRVADWLAGSANLPAETQVYVVSVTGATAEDWKRDRELATATTEPERNESCAAVTAELRTEEGAGETAAPLAPWGVQLAGNFSKALALASFARAEQHYRGVLGDVRPMILGRVLRSRGWRPFYRIMIPEASRGEADRACQAIMAAGGACVPVRT